MKTVILLALISQFPQQPDKSQPQAQAAIPSKTTPLASPQVQASPQQTYQADVSQATVVLRAVPQVYAVQRLVTVQAAPVAYSAVAYDTGCVAQQQVVQRSFVQHSAVVSHGVVHQAQVSHGVVGAGVGRAARAPKKVVTKQVTKTKRGLLGGLFGG